MARHNDEQYNRFPYQNPSQGITLRKKIIPLSKPIARHYDEKYNQFPYQNQSRKGLR